ncbi:IS66 family insertion sequence element accessory protein TnpB [Dolosicoccus paucivorans]|uniref:IS66 family insertion sequence element accessory protein TnpB n=1 Tax=Dolosicoccus paucivorans TaxID=84521 RepID=UPI0015E13E4E|nr:IS66 family insertion sequence element accessory protein TnpB [Dolosicoccus paucivorans]
MIRLTEEDSYYIVYGKTDLRKGIDTLAILLQHDFNHDPFDGAYYFFCGSRSDRFKILHWDGEGFQLIYKRLENGKVHWPRANQACLEAMSLMEVTRLLKGFPLKSSISVSSKSYFISVLVAVFWDQI